MNFATKGRGLFRLVPKQGRLLLRILEPRGSCNTMTHKANLSTEIGDGRSGSQKGWERIIWSGSSDLLVAGTLEYLEEVLQWRDLLQVVEHPDGRNFSGMGRRPLKCHTQAIKVGNKKIQGLTPTFSQGLSKEVFSQELKRDVEKNFLSLNSALALNTRGQAFI